MGWDVSPISRSIKTKAYIQHEIKRDYPDYELVKIVEGKNNGGYKPFFVALKRKDASIFALVVLTKRKNGTIAEKRIGESAGPAQLAPVSFINLLTPTESEWANEWRTQSLANAS